jgi:hypothetical protein
MLNNSMEVHYLISKKENSSGKSIKDNDKIIGDFRKGKYDVLINIRILGSDPKIGWSFGTLLQIAIL